MKKILIPLVIILLLCAVCALTTSAAPENEVYVSDNGNDANSGNGKTSALKTIEAAYEKLGSAGGAIVISDTFTLTAKDAVMLPSCEGEVRFTSLSQNGTDYKKEGAVLVLEKSVRINSDTVFSNIKIKSAPSIFFACRGHNVHFAENIDVTLTSGSVYPTILGGDDATSASTESSLSFSDFTITVDSGTYNYIKGTNNRSDSSHPLGICGNISIIINGGTFKAAGGANSNDTALISIGGFASQKGDYYLEINGGSFQSSIFGIGRSGGNSTAAYNTNEGDVTIKITGGNFVCREISAVQNTLDSRINGKYTVIITGGSFTSALTQISAKGAKGETEAFITDDALRSKLVGFDSTLYLDSVKGSDKNSGKTPEQALKTLGAAAKALEDGGRVVLMNATTLPASLDMDGERLTITSSYYENDYSKKASLVVEGDSLVKAELILENVTLAGKGKLTAGGKLTAEKGTKTEKGAQISLSAGECEGVSTLCVLGGDFYAIDGGAGKEGAIVVLKDCTVASDAVGAVKKTASASVLLDNAKVSGNITASAAGTDGDCSVFAHGGSFGKIYATAEGKSVGGNFYVITDKSEIEASSVGVSGKAYSSVKADGFEAAERVVFVSDERLSLEQAYAELGDAGGVIVVAGKLTIGEFSAPKHSGKVTITSSFAGLDLRELCEPEIRLADTLALGGKTLIEKTDLLALTESTYIVCGGAETVIGEEVECEVFFDRGVRYYTSIAGGQLYYMSKEYGYGSDSISLTIKSGTWGGVYGGNLRRSGGSTTNKKVSVPITLTIDGGRFLSGVSASGMNSISSEVVLNINGGTFDCGIYAISRPSPILSDKINVSSSVTVNINGGGIHGELALFCTDGGANFTGSYTLNVNGGELSRVTEIRGGTSDEIKAKCTINIAEGVDTTSTLEGFAEYQNPISQYADPSVYYYKGYYYYTYAATYNGKPAIYMTKAPNVCDIGNSEPRLVWFAGADSGRPDMKSVWGMQMYVLDGYCWLYATCTSPSAEGRRIHIWRSDSDSPDGTFSYYGEMQNINDDIHNYNSPRLIEHGGKRYLSFGGIVNKETDSIEGQRHFQSLMIAEIDTPYSFCSEVVVITTPTKRWEIEENGKVQIVEGSFQLRAPDGTLYISYCAAQTAGDDYCMGLLEFKGGENDSLLDAELWYKHPQPILQKNTDVSVYSTGALVYVPTPDGDALIGVYHAKLHTNSSYNGRCLFLTTVGWKDDHSPVIGQPQALDTVFTLPLNSMPLEYRIKGFSNFEEKIYDIGDNGNGNGNGNGTTVARGDDNTLLVIIGAVSGVLIVGCICVLALTLTAPKKKPKEKQ